MANAINEKLRTECATALQTLEKINEYRDLQSNLSWCLGSYDHDLNPVGLHQFGQAALDSLKEYKEKNPRKVAKKVIDGLEASLRNYEASLN